MLGREDLKHIITIFVNLSLVLLPLYGTDFPTKDRRSYYRLVIQWYKKTGDVIDTIIRDFKSGKEGASGRITMRQFVDQCHTHDIFNVIKIREIAKRTTVLANANPNINRESTQGLDLFSFGVPEQDEKDQEAN